MKVRLASTVGAMAGQWNIKRWWGEFERSRTDGERRLSNSRWPVGGRPITDLSADRQYWVRGKDYVSLCHPDRDLVLEEARARIPNGYKTLMLYEKIAVAHPDGTVTEWTEAPDGDAPFLGRAAGYDLEPPAPHLPGEAGYPDVWNADASGRAAAVAAAIRVAAVVGHDIPVGRVRDAVFWH